MFLFGTMKKTKWPYKLEKLTINEPTVVERLQADICQIINQKITMVTFLISELQRTICCHHSKSMFALFEESVCL